MRLFLQVGTGLGPMHAYAGSVQSITQTARQSQVKDETVSPCHKTCQSHCRLQPLGQFVTWELGLGWWYRYTFAADAV